MQNKSTVYLDEFTKSNLPSNVQRSDFDQLLEDLRYHAVPAKYQKGHDKDIYLQAFDCWHSVWREEFNSLHPGDPFFSDAFTRQDIIGCLFYKNICVALSFFQFVDMSLTPHQMDSYFGCWPAEAVESLTKVSNEIIICSNFTVRKEWRKEKNLPIQFGQISCGLHVKYFLSQSTPAMTGAMRCDRGAHKLAYMFGARPLKQNVKSPHGDLIDIVGFFHGQAHTGESHSSAKTCIEKIWEQSKNTLTERFAA